jgi:hypothetical protein
MELGFLLQDLSDDGESSYRKLAMYDLQANFYEKKGFFLEATKNRRLLLEQSHTSPQANDVDQIKLVICNYIALALDLYYLGNYK